MHEVGNARNPERHCVGCESKEQVQGERKLSPEQDI